jgi:hypothetical protein
LFSTNDQKMTNCEKKWPFFSFGKKWPFFFHNWSFFDHLWKQMVTFLAIFFTQLVKLRDWKWPFVEKKWPKNDQLFFANDHFFPSEKNNQLWKKMVKIWPIVKTIGQKMTNCQKKWSFFDHFFWPFFLTIGHFLTICFHNWSFLAIFDQNPNTKA